MSVHLASLNDLDELTPLMAAYLTFYEVPRPLPEVRAFLAARLDQSDSVLLLARHADGEAQGFIQLYPLFSSLELRPAYLLSDLYVHPQHRRQGVAQALMQAARGHAEFTGACGLQLETAKTNLAGQALYEKLGYVRDPMFYTYWLSLKP